MKRILIILILLLATLCSCNKGGYVNMVEIVEVKSNIYTEEEIASAVNTVKTYFKKNFEGCVLWEIRYAGDESDSEAKEWAKQYGSEKVIILISTFGTDENGGDGSLNPNDTYTDWKWILAKDDTGRWQHKTHGYG